MQLYTIQIDGPRHSLTPLRNYLTKRMKLKMRCQMQHDYRTRIQIKQTQHVKKSRGLATPALVLCFFTKDKCNSKTTHHNHTNQNCKSVNAFV